MRRLILTLLLTLSSPALAQPADTLDASVVEHLREREGDLLQRVRTFDASRFEQLTQLKAMDERAYWTALMRVARLVDRHQAPPPELRDQLRRLEDLKARHPNGIDDLTPAEREGIEAELTAIAERIFEIKQAERRRRIEQMRTALTELEADVARRDRERATLIARFVEDVMRGDPDL